MHLEISHVVNHPIERVWKVLLESDVLRRALPGIEKLETTHPGRRGMKRSASRQTRDRA
jgi:carbon monoxide dehydrogenase subunit G